MGSRRVLLVCVLLAVGTHRNAAFPQRTERAQIPAAGQQTEERKVSTVSSYNRTSHRTTSVVHQERSPEPLTSSQSQQELGRRSSGLAERSVLGPTGRSSQRSVLTEDVRRVRHSNASGVQTLHETLGAARSDQHSHSGLLGNTNSTLRFALGSLSRAASALADAGDGGGGGGGTLISADLLRGNVTRCDDCLTPARLDVSVTSLRPASLGAEGSRSGNSIGSLELPLIGGSSSASASGEPSLGASAAGHRLRGGSGSKGKGAVDLADTEQCRDDCCALTNIHSTCTCYQIRLASNACIVQHLP